MKERESETRCPLCVQSVYGNLGVHVKQQHGEERFRQAVLTSKAHGMPDAEIGKRYDISFRQLEQIITEAYGTNISVLEAPKRIKSWHPKNFRRETTTVWSFKQRGNWATHDGRYRGNWSPYIPRNVILRYSHPGDVVLDYFVGGGTTAVEANLLGRRCIARDINPGAVSLTLEGLSFTHPTHLFSEQNYEPEVSVGDARDLSDIASNSVDLICAHPPYAGIIKYSSAVEGDLSDLSVPDFLGEMDKVARESMRVLRPGGKCAILIGDTRKSKRVVPIGFQTIRVFLDAGFALQELIIKRQHNCKTTGFWYTRSIQHNFLLLAHEYLPIFEKPKAQQIAEQRSFWVYNLPCRAAVGQVRRSEEQKLETTTVWIFPKECLEAEMKRNLQQRFSVPESEFIEVHFNNGSTELDIASNLNLSLVHVHSLQQIANEHTLMGYRASVRNAAKKAAELLLKGGFFVIEASDTRIGDTFLPVGLFLYEDMTRYQDFAIREIVIVVPEESPESTSSEHLEIIHRYLLVYTHK